MTDEDPPAARPPAAAWHARIVAELATQRRSKNWLHRRTGVARSTIDGWATQPKTPQARTVALVAEALEVPEGEAFALAGIQEPTEAVPVDESRQVDPSQMSNAELAAGITTLAEELRRRAEG